LDRCLGNISYQQKKEILYDYEEHFSIGIENGKTEEEIADSLGNPQNIAKQFKADCLLKIAETEKSTGNVFRAVLAVVGLGFFNLVFVFGPFMGVVGVLIGLFAAALGISVSGIALLAASILYPIYPGLVSMPYGFPFNQTAFMFISVGLACLGILFTIGVWKLCQGFYNLTLKYLKANLNIIKR
jgi:uncharacterized membrane protein